MGNISILQNKVEDFLRKENLSYCKLSRLVNEHDSSFISMIKGRRPLNEKIIKRLLPILKIPKGELESWIVADKYAKEIIKLAIKNRKNFPYKRKSILTTKIDQILNERGISRTTLSKEIKYSQSGLNETIIGKRGLSKYVLQRLSVVLEVPQDEILSWSIADKYSLETLEMAWDYKADFEVD